MTAQRRYDLLINESEAVGFDKGVRGSGRHGREWSVAGKSRHRREGRQAEETGANESSPKGERLHKSRNDSRGPNILTVGKCPATLPRSRLSVNRPSRPKDQQIFRERERCNQPRSHAALLRQFPGRCEAARRGRFA